MNGRFITFEGIEGCGKTTQIKLLNDALKKRGIETVLTREPGGTKIGDKIRKVLLDAANSEMVALAELLLYEASRAQHVEEKIRPALSAGKVVLCDRFYDSSSAYQGAARKLKSSLVHRLNDIATSGLTPDLTIILDISPKAGLARAKGRGKPDRLESEELEFHLRVRAGFLKLAKDEPRRVVVVNGSGEVGEIHREIIKLIDACPFHTSGV